MSQGVNLLQHVYRNAEMGRGTIPQVMQVSADPALRSILGDQLREYQVSVGGQVIGVVKDEAALNEMLEAMKAQYVTENTVSVDFVEDVTVDYVYASDVLMSTSTSEA